MIPIQIAIAHENLKIEGPNLYAFATEYCALNGFSIEECNRFRKSGAGRFAFDTGTRGMSVSISPGNMPFPAQEEFRALVKKNECIAADGANSIAAVALDAVDVPYRKFRNIYPEFCEAADCKAKAALESYFARTGKEPDGIFARRYAKGKILVIAKSNSDLIELATLGKNESKGVIKQQLSDMEYAILHGALEKIDLSEELIRDLSIEDLCQTVKDRIKEKLALSEKVFTVNFANRLIGMNLSLKINLYSEFFFSTLDMNTLCKLKNDNKALREYYIEVADDLSQKLEAQRNRWEAGLKADYLKKNKVHEYHELVISAINECLNSIELSGSGITWDILFRDTTLMIKFLCRGVPFKCVLSKEHGTSITRIFAGLTDPIWLAPYVEFTLKSEGGIPVRQYKLDIKPIVSEKLSTIIPALKDIFCNIKLEAEDGLVLPDDVRSLKMEFEEAEVKYRTWNIPYIDGNINTIEKGVYAPAKVRLSLRAPYFTLENAIGVLFFDDNQLKYSWTDWYNAFLKEQSSKMHERCRAYAKEAFAPYSKIGCKNNSRGILYGDTSLKLSLGDLTIPEYEYKTFSYKNSVTEWRKALKENIKNIEKMFKEAEEEKSKILCDKYKFWLDSYLVRDVFEFINKNDRYITENAVVQAMRGLSIALDTDITITHGYGEYNLLENDAIKDCVSELICKGAITTRTLKGTYGHFDILKANPAFCKDLATFRKIAENKETEMSKNGIKEIEKKLKAQEYITDPEVKVYLQHVVENHSENLESSVYMSLLSVADRYYILASHESEIRKIFEDAPGVIKQFINIKHSAATAKEKKILKRFFRM